MYCPDCGNVIKSGENFCTKCGRKIITYQNTQVNINTNSVPINNWSVPRANMEPKTWQHLSILMSFVYVLASFVGISFRSNDGISLWFHYPQSFNLYSVYYYIVPLLLAFTVCIKNNCNILQIFLLPLALDVMLPLIFAMNSTVHIYLVINTTCKVVLIWLTYKTLYIPIAYAKNLYNFGIAIAVIYSIFIFIPDLDYFSFTTTFSDSYWVDVSGYLRQISPYLCYACIGKECVA